MKIKFTVPGDPIPWARPRVGYGGKFFTKPEDGYYREKVRNYSLPTRPKEPFSGPVSLELVFRVRKPKRLKKGALWSHKRPDIDNLVKAISDSLDGLYYFDDGQISKVEAIKIYGDETGVDVTVEELAHKGDQK